MLLQLDSVAPTLVYELYFAFFGQPAYSHVDFRVRNIYSVYYRGNRAFSFSFKVIPDVSCRFTDSIFHKNTNKSKRWKPV